MAMNMEGQVHRFKVVHGFGPWQRRPGVWQVKPPSNQEGGLSCKGGHGELRDDVLLERSCRRCLLITKEESLVVHFACCSFVDSINHKNGNFGAFVTELRAGMSPCAYYSVHVSVAGDPEPAASRGNLARVGRLVRDSCGRGLVSAPRETSVGLHQDLAIF